jgi:hypothetical protein
MKPRQTYATKDEALLALFKEVYWNPSEFQAVFEDDEGRYFYTTDETENFRLLDEYEESGKMYYDANDDPTYERIYDGEVKRAYDQLIPATHSDHAFLWEKCKSDLTSSSDGLGGMTDPDAVVEGDLGWVAKAREIWIEELSKLTGHNKTLPKDTDRYPHEMAGYSIQLWRAQDITTEDEYREFVQAWAVDEL